MSGLNIPIQLIVGLSNPGKEYAKTRHNAGAWFVEKLAHAFQLNLRQETKFHGFHAQFTSDHQRCHILLPQTFMNASGRAIHAVAAFYRIPTNAILVIHDELDLVVGDVRLKFDGGHGGHNGLRDTIHHLQTTQFYRLRVGIGHPGERDLVADYVLSAPSKAEYAQIEACLDRVMPVVPDLLQGRHASAMQSLHTK